MPANVAVKASGTVILAMKVGQNRRRKKKMTSTTSAILSIMDNWTSWTEASMVRVRSLKAVIFIDGGNHWATWGNSFLMRSTVSMTLASACLKIITNTAWLVLAQPA